MKFILSIMVLTLSLSSYAGVKEDVLSLGKLAMGQSSTPVKGKTAEEMLSKFTEVDQKDLVFKEINEMNGADEVNVGLTSLKTAQAMKLFAIDFIREAIEGQEANEVEKSRKKIKNLEGNWSPLILKLNQEGVKFGYTGNGPGYCGVSFVNLIIIDVKSQTVYEVQLSEGGDC